MQIEKEEFNLIIDSISKTAENVDVLVGKVAKMAVHIVALEAVVKVLVEENGIDTTNVYSKVREIVDNDDVLDMAASLCIYKTK